MVKLETKLWSLKYSRICEIDSANGFLSSSSFKLLLFSASYPKLKHCLTAGKEIGISNCHATRGHRKLANFTSIVYGTNRVQPQS
jgi:hypothetical protein